MADNEFTIKVEAPDPNLVDFAAKSQMKRSAFAEAVAERREELGDEDAALRRRVRRRRLERSAEFEAGLVDPAFQAEIDTRRAERKREVYLNRLLVDEDFAAKEWDKSAAKMKQDFEKAQREEQRSEKRDMREVEDEMRTNLRVERALRQQQRADQRDLDVANAAIAKQNRLEERSARFANREFSRDLAREEREQQRRADRERQQQLTGIQGGLGLVSQITGGGSGISSILTGALGGSAFGVAGGIVQAVQEGIDLTRRVAGSVGEMRAGAAGLDVRRVQEGEISLLQNIPLVGGLFADLARQTLSVRDALGQTAENLSGFSGVLAGATALAGVERTIGDIRRAQRVGPDLARFARARVAQEEVERDFLAENIPDEVNRQNAAFANRQARIELAREGRLVFDIRDPILAMAQIAQREMEILERIENQVRQMNQPGQGDVAGWGRQLIGDHLQVPDNFGFGPGAAPGLPQQEAFGDF